MNEQTQKAFDFIVSCCPGIGAFQGTGEPQAFLMQAADDIYAAKPSVMFPDRYKEHVAYALTMTAKRGFLDPPAAISAVYLATRFEFYFRLLSEKLESDGSWRSSSAQSQAKAAIKDNRIDRKRISSLALAYKIMKLNTANTTVTVCEQLDKKLYPKPCVMPDKDEIKNVGDRIEWARNRAAHGEWGDISADTIFYGLLTALIFYSHTS